MMRDSGRQYNMEATQTNGVTALETPGKTSAYPAEQPAKRRSGPNGWLLALPAIIYLLAWTVYPLLYAVYISLTDRQLNRPLSGSFIGLDNYVRLVQDPAVRTAITNTLTVMAVSIAVELVFGYLAAKLFFRTQHLPGIGTMRTVFVAPIMLTPLIVGLFWAYILNPTTGIANHVLESISLPTISWFGNPDLALFTIIGINVWQWLPFTMLLVLAGLNNIPKDLQEVSTLEGANWLQRLRNLEIPFITEVAVLGVLIRVMENLKLFDIVYATTNGGPGSATEVVSLMAYRQSFLFFDTAYGAAIAILILILSNILVLLLFRTLLKREAVS